MRQMIWSVLPKDGDDRPKAVKKLRKQVLLALQLDEDDKNSKKIFKSVIQDLETSKELKIDEEGRIKVLAKKRSSDDAGDEKKSKKKQKKEKEEQHQEETTQEENQEPSERNKPCKGNPQGVTRLFLGNLPFSVDEASLQDFMPGQVTHIKWITDKETGKFYGSAFIEVDNSTTAAKAVAMAGQQLMGRPIKVNFAPSRPGDIWPPPAKVMAGGSGGQAGGSGIKAMSEKPELCTKLFMGNCSFEIDDETIIRFFGAIDAEVKAIRWLHHKDSGDFKGCGYAEFYTTEACEKAATLNGKTLMGRPIRLDWAE